MKHPILFAIILGVIFALACLLHFGIGFSVKVIAVVGVVALVIYFVYDFVENEGWK